MIIHGLKVNKKLAWIKKMILKILTIIEIV
jgi:hypothetical protein